MLGLALHNRVLEIKSLRERVKGYFNTKLCGRKKGLITRHCLRVLSKILIKIAGYKSLLEQKQLKLEQKRIVRGNIN